MAQKIADTFNAKEAEGKNLDTCFAETAQEFGISIDDVVDALNEIAFA